MILSGQGDRSCDRDKKGWKGKYSLCPGVSGSNSNIHSFIYSYTLWSHIAKRRMKFVVSLPLNTALAAAVRHPWADARGIKEFNNEMNYNLLSRNQNCA